MATYMRMNTPQTKSRDEWREPKSGEGISIGIEADNGSMTYGLGEASLTKKGNKWILTDWANINSLFSPKFIDYVKTNSKINGAFITLGGYAESRPSWNGREWVAIWDLESIMTSLLNDGFFSPIKFMDEGLYVISPKGGKLIVENEVKWLEYITNNNDLPMIVPIRTEAEVESPDGYIAVYNGTLTQLKKKGRLFKLDKALPKGSYLLKIDD